MEGERQEGTWRDPTVVGVGALSAPTVVPVAAAGAEAKAGAGVAGQVGIGATVAQADIGRGTVEMGEVEALAENIPTGEDKAGRRVEAGTGKITRTRMGMVPRRGSTAQTVEMR